MAAHNDLGQLGEELAAKYLRRKGWFIRHRNWRCGHRDIDIVASDEWGRQLVFVEVKTRSADTLINPAMAVDREKIDSLRKAAHVYVKQMRTDAELRFDIISIVMPKVGEAEIEHIENAF